MRSKATLTLLLLTLSLTGHSQVSLRSEYIGSSPYWVELGGLLDSDRERVKDARGTARVLQGDVMLPLSTQISADSMVTTWGLALSGAYAKLEHDNFSGEMVSEILNLQAGVYYMTPFNKRWSGVFTIGGGTYAPSTELTDVGPDQLLGSVGVTFIRHLKPNLDIGAGVAINSAFGYPMAFPTIYVDWSFERDFSLYVTMTNGLDIKASYQLSDYFSLNLVSRLNGQLALLEHGGKSVMFTHQYLVTGISPEVSLGKHVSFSVTGGISAIRPTYYNDRTLSGLLLGDHTFYFGGAPYGAATLILK